MERDVLVERVNAHQVALDTPSPQLVNIWLDDLRHAPTGWWHAINYAEFVQFLWAIQAQGLAVGTISFDHDLAPEHYVVSKDWRRTESAIPTGWDCLMTLYVSKIIPDRLVLHTWNHPAAMRMFVFAHDYKLAPTILIEPAKEAV